jgi:hypothetical protein
MPDNAGEFNGSGKLVGPESLAECAARCDALERQGCVGWVYSPSANTCYMRKLQEGAAGGDCAAAIVPAPRYAVYTRNASCAFPPGWRPPGGGGGGGGGAAAAPDTPTTPGLLPNVTLSPDRPV